MQGIRPPPVRSGRIPPEAPILREIANPTDINLQDIGAICLYDEYARRATLDAEEMAAIRLYAHNLVDAFHKRTHPDLEAQMQDILHNTHTIARQLEDVETRLGQVETRLGQVETRLGGLEQSVRESAIGFARWSIQQSQVANSQAKTSDHLQLVAYPNGMWPQAAPDRPLLDSVQAIRDLNGEALVDYFQDYRLALAPGTPWTDAALRDRLMDHLGVPRYLQTANIV